MTVKPRTNYTLDMLILGLFVVVMLSGLLLWLVYPHGGTRSGQSHGRGGGRIAEDIVTDTTAVLGLSRSEMDTIHDWSGVAVGVLVLVHIVFHWKWIVCQTRQIFRPKARRSRSQPCTND